MHVTALPGRRSETEAWLRSVLVAAGFPEAVVTRYRHWDTEVEANVAFEAARLANQSPPLVIAKSLGTVIAATAFCLHKFRPTGAVLIGTPYAALESGDLRFLQQFSAAVETLFIQQSEDPGGSAAELAAGRDADDPSSPSQSSWRSSPAPGCTPRPRPGRARRAVFCSWRRS